MFTLPVLEPLISRVHALQRAQPANRGRLIIGLCGAPAAGKSTLAQALVNALGPQAQYLPLDGFHLSNPVLDRLGLRQRKGAPETFDAAGYAHLLQRLRHEKQTVIYAPDFDRTLDTSIAAAIALSADCSMVITEGNYLLLPQAPWTSARDCMDQVWYLQLPTAVRLARLHQRHISFGRSATAAHEWIQNSDEPNAQLIASHAQRADWQIAFD